jgi:hypothetical protein
LITTHGSGKSSLPNLLPIPFFKKYILYQMNKSKIYRDPIYKTIDDEQLTGDNFKDNSKTKSGSQEILKTFNQEKVKRKELKHDTFLF